MFTERTSRLVAVMSFSLLANGAKLPSSARVEAIRYWSFGDVTRIAIQTQGEYRLKSSQSERPARVFFDFSGIRPPVAAKLGFETIAVNDRRVKRIRVEPITGGSTRVIFDLSGPARIVSSQLVNPNRLIIEIRPKTAYPGLLLARSAPKTQHFAEVASVTAPAKPPLGHTDTKSTAVVSDAPAISVPLKPVAGTSTAVALNVPPPVKIVPGSSTIPATPTQSTAAQATDNAPATQPASSTQPAAVVGLPPNPSQKPDRSLVRVLGLKMTKVVIDPGHGGHDTGTIGPDGLLEKDLVLDVALRLGDLITKKLGAQVVYTRTSDVFIPLETRTRIADDEKADLFISIHANSSPEPYATGVETYYFNLTSDKAGLDLATRENAVSASSISDLNDMLHRAVLETKLEESREFAQAVQSSLWSESVKMNSRSRDRGVRKAPFVVLIGATMPSILAEIGFVSNPHDERLLRQTDQRQRIADALFKGIDRYSQSLNRTQLARASSSGR